MVRLKSHIPGKKMYVKCSKLRKCQIFEPVAVKLSPAETILFHVTHPRTVRAFANMLVARAQHICKNTSHQFSHMSSEVEMLCEELRTADAADERELKSNTLAQTTCS
jgi:hypothetical protein